MNYDPNSNDFAIAAIVFLGSVSAAIFFLVPAPYLQIAFMVAAASSFLVGILADVVILRYRTKRKKLARTGFESVWSPLDESKINDVFKRHIARNTQATIPLGYLPVGVHLVKETPRLRNEAACLLHPQGHSLIQLAHCGQLRVIEILSFLDDGSVIGSSDINSNAQSLFSKMAQHGFLMTLSPYAPIEILIETHNASVQAVLADPNIGLRELSAKDWRQYALYASRRFDQIRFELGELNNAPEPFTFPSGNLVKEDDIKSTGNATCPLPSTPDCSHVG